MQTSPRNDFDGVGSWNGASHMLTSFLETMMFSSHQRSGEIFKFYLFSVTRPPSRLLLWRRMEFRFIAVNGSLTVEGTKIIQFWWFCFLLNFELESLRGQLHNAFLLMLTLLSSWAPNTSRWSLNIEILTPCEERRYPLCCRRNFLLIDWNYHLPACWRLTESFLYDRPCAWSYGVLVFVFGLPLAGWLAVVI